MALLATVLQVLVGHAAGRALPLFAAIPLVLSVCFVAPVVLAALDTAGFAIYSTVNNGVLVPEMAIGEEFYSLQLAMATGSVVALGLLLAGPRRAVRVTATLFAGATLALAVYAFVAQPPRDHLAGRSGAKFECTTQSGVTVCVALDDVRFMPRLLDAALEVRAALPAEATPSTYVQVGLATQASEEARLSLVATRSGDAVSDIAGVAARWHTCDGIDPNVLLGRELWLLATVRGDREALKFEVVQRAMPASEDASSAWAEVQFPQCVGGEGETDAG
ncbi:hypothetical protein JT358_08020 [Micrococcales bacterium 31B]|nr:hypothetical protein [Micrococcales bacterium 31B]